MQIAIRTVLFIVVFAAGFAAGFPAGKSSGFSSGSEWALVQADLLASEAGLDMPVSLEDGQFRVVIRQPRHLYRSAWRRADRHEAKPAYLAMGAIEQNVRTEGTERVR